MATLASFSPHVILQRLIHRPVAPSCFRAAVFSHSKKSFPLLRTAPSFTSSRFNFSSLSSSHSIPQQFASDAASLDNVRTELEGEIDTASVSTDSELPEDSDSEVIKAVQPPRPPPPPPPSLSMKEKKDLASYAHSLGKKLKSQQIGKSGVTYTVIGALLETLEANELLKLKIHNTCPGELDDVMKQLEESTGSVVVGQIGRTVILYRPGLSKMKAEEKKKQVQRAFLKRQSSFRPFPKSRRPSAVPAEESRLAGRGRRGSSRI